MVRGDALNLHLERQLTMPDVNRAIVGARIVYRDQHETTDRNPASFCEDEHEANTE